MNALAGPGRPVARFAFCLSAHGGVGRTPSVHLHYQIMANPKSISKTLFSTHSVEKLTNVAGQFDCCSQRPGQPALRGNGGGGQQQWHTLRHAPQVEPAVATAVVIRFFAREGVLVIDRAARRPQALIVDLDPSSHPLQLTPLNSDFDNASPCIGLGPLI